VVIGLVPKAGLEPARFETGLILVSLRLYLENPLLFVIAIYQIYVHAFPLL